MVGYWAAVSGGALVCLLCGGFALWIAERRNVFSRSTLACLNYPQGMDCESLQRVLTPDEAVRVSESIVRSKWTTRRYKQFALDCKDNLLYDDDPICLAFNSSDCDYAEEPMPAGYQMAAHAHGYRQICVPGNEIKIGVLLHEIAHLIEYAYVRGGKFDKDYGGRHSPAFVGIFIHLVRKFVGWTTSRSLRWEYAKKGGIVMPYWIRRLKHNVGIWRDRIWSKCRFSYLELSPHAKSSNMYHRWRWLWHMSKLRHLRWRDIDAARKQERARSRLARRVAYAHKQRAGSKPLLCSSDLAKGIYQSNSSVRRAIKRAAQDEMYERVYSEPIYRLCRETGKEAVKLGAKPPPSRADTP